MSVVEILTSHVVSFPRELRPVQIYDSTSDGRERAGACEDGVRYWMAEEEIELTEVQLSWLL